MSRKKKQQEPSDKMYTHNALAFDLQLENVCEQPKMVMAITHRHETIKEVSHIFHHQTSREQYREERKEFIQPIREKLVEQPIQFKFDVPFMLLSLSKSMTPVKARQIIRNLKSKI